MGGLSNVMESRVLNSILRAQAWTAVPGVTISLHTADPGETGANEVTGGSYARQAATFDASTDGSPCTLSDAVEFEGMPACTVTHAGLWTTDAVPVYIGGGPLDAPKTLGAGDTYRLTQFTATLD